MTKYCINWGLSMQICEFMGVFSFEPLHHLSHPTGINDVSVRSPCLPLLATVKPGPLNFQMANEVLETIENPFPRPILSRIRHIAGLCTMHP